MTQEDILRMAREAGLAIAYSERDEDGWKELASFAALVAAAERQRCAQIAREFDRDHPLTNYGGFIARIIEAPDASQP